MSGDVDKPELGESGSEREAGTGPASATRLRAPVAAGRSALATLKVADRSKAAQDALPAAAVLKAGVGKAMSAIWREAFDADARKARRALLAAKVEALLKARPPGNPEQAPLSRTASEHDQSGQTGQRPGDEPDSDLAVTTGSAPASLSGRPDVRTLKSRLDNALRQSTSRHTAGVASHPPTSGLSSNTDGRVDEPMSRRIGDIGPGGADRPRSTAERGLAGGRADPADPSAEMQTSPAVGAKGSDDSEVASPTVRTRGLVTERIVRAEIAAERNRPIFSLGLFIAALTAGGVLHILTVFAVIWFNAGSAYERLSWQLEANTMRIFPFDPNGQTPLPFLTADMRYAMCRYDLTNGSVQVSAVLPDIGWSLTLYTPNGDNFYAVPGLEGRTVTADFMLNVPGDRLLLPQPGVRRVDIDAGQVTSPQRQGLIVLRAPNLGPAHAAAVEQAMRQSTCRVMVRR